MKRNSAILALLALVIMASTSLMPASARSSNHSQYDHMITLRFKEKWLLPPIQLRNGEVTWVLGFNRMLRPFSNGMLARNIEKVDLTFQGAPFGPDVLKTRDQANALTQLGMLAAMGHFAVLNASDAEVKTGAIQVINQLADIADHYKIGNLAAQYQRLANDVADPRFVGGSNPIVQRYDATVAALYDWVAWSYGVDGDWYFTNGTIWPGLYVLSLTCDRLHTEYYLSVLDDLFHSKPRLFPDVYARAVQRDVIADPTWDSQYFNNVAWATMMHYGTGSNYYASPRQPHWDINKNRIAVP